MVASVVIGGDKGVPCLTKAQIMAKTGLSKCYVERALSRKWLRGHKVLMQGTKVEMWVVTVPDFEAWRKSCLEHKAPRAQFVGTERQLAELYDFLAQAKVKQEDIATLKASLQARKIG